jgi:mannose-6-phosphate isomerase-like protein (cupin superfamily)
MKLEIKRFDTPDERRTFDKGKFEVITLGGVTVGKATYEPGWKWSEHVGASRGSNSCPVEHVVLVLAGRAAVAMDEGKTVEIAGGDLAYVPAGHDSWVVGDEPYVSLHFLGATDYAYSKE